MQFVIKPWWLPRSQVWEGLKPPVHCPPPRSATCWAPHEDVKTQPFTPSPVGGRALISRQPVLPTLALAFVKFFPRRSLRSISHWCWLGSWVTQNPLGSSSTDSHVTLWAWASFPKLISVASTPHSGLPCPWSCVWMASSCQCPLPSPGILSMSLRAQSLVPPAPSFPPWGAHLAHGYKHVTPPRHIPIWGGAPGSSQGIYSTLMSNSQTTPNAPNTELLSPPCTCAPSAPVLVGEGVPSHPFRGSGWTPEASLTSSLPIPLPLRKSPDSSFRTCQNLTTPHKPHLPPPPNAVASAWTFRVPRDLPLASLNLISKCLSSKYPEWRVLGGQPGVSEVHRGTTP